MIKNNEKSESEIGFLKKLYLEDPLIADRSVLATLKDRFPNSRATNATLYTWKVQLRNMGIKIPLRRKIR